MYLLIFMGITIIIQLSVKEQETRRLQSRECERIGFVDEDEGVLARG